MSGIPLNRVRVEHHVVDGLILKDARHFRKEYPKFFPVDVGVLDCEIFRKEPLKDEIWQTLSSVDDFFTFRS